jgi:SAM-dependent methyltransferase
MTAVTFNALHDLLNHITAAQPDTAAFLENDRGREAVYSQSSTHRWLEVIQILEKAGTTQKCLDIGTSPLTFALKHFCTEVDTLDFSNHFARRCQEAGVRLYLPGRDWLENLPDNHYDSIVFLEVIEHLHMNPENVLEELKKKLRPGGCLIVSTPNLMCFGNRIRMLTNGKLAHLHYPPYTPVGLHGRGHDRIYTPAEMKEYFQNTHWERFDVGYHSIAVSDSIGQFPFWKRPLYLPVLLIKYFLPSTRQLMLMVATK